MSLPARQRRILERIEGGLASSDPALTSLFVIFERLTQEDGMPGVEAVRPQPVRDRLAWLAGRARRLTRRPAARMRALLLVPAALAAMACAVTIAAVSPGGHRSGPGRQQAREQVVKCRPVLARVPVPACQTAGGRT